jgi:hypothetical protein
MPILAPRRVLLSQIDTLPSHCPVRVVGVVVQIASNFLVLDDGSLCTKIDSAQLDTTVGVIGDVIMVIGNWTGEILQANTIVWKVDRNMEALQWQEALHTGPMKNGIPYKPVDKAEVFRFISLDAEGISLEDLALVLDMQQNEMFLIVQQLQEEGAVYLNRQGLYVPL